MTTTNTNSSARTLTIPNLVNGQIYRARVSAVNNYGQGPFANWIQVTPSEFSTDQYYYDNTLLMHMDLLNEPTDQYASSVSLYLNGESGITTDSSLNPQGVNNSNIQLSSSIKKFGNQSLYWDGGGQRYLSTNDVSAFGFGTGDFTLEAWIYPLALDSYRTLFSIGYYNSGLLWRITNGDGLYFNGTNYSNWGSTDQININQWNHVALTRSSGTVRTFINGVKTFEVSGGQAASDIYSSRMAVIGAGPHASNNENFYGYMDDIRITKGVARYTSNFTPYTSPITLQKTLIDSSAYNNQLIASSSISVSSGSSKFGGYSGYFNGSSFVRSPGTDVWQLGTDDFTVESWINPDSIWGYKPIAGTYDGGNGGWKLAIRSPSTGGTVTYGPQVDFSTGAYGTEVDVIIAGQLEITRGNQQGIYNSAKEGNYYRGGGTWYSPIDTLWNSDGWGDLSNTPYRSFQSWRDSYRSKVGTPSIGNLEFIMKHVPTNRYWLIKFTGWGQGGGNGGSFSYTRKEILSISFNSSIIEFRNGDNSVASATATIPTGDWSHVAAVRSTGVIKLFLDGTQVGSNSPFTANITRNNSYGLSVGSVILSDGSVPHYFNGYLDDLRITKGVARYASNFNKPVAPAPDLGPASTVPSTPSNLTVSEDQGIVSLSWSRPSYPRVVDTRAPITYYGVEYSSDNGSSWTEHSVVSGGSLLTRSISGLPSNTPYLFRVRAQNSVGFGNYSSTANISTLTNVPSSVSAIGDNNQAYVSWTAPTPNNSSIRDYSVQYSSDAGSSWITFSHSPSIDTLINVTGLNNSSDYIFKVAAVNLAGIGTYSSNSSSINVAPRSDNLYNKTRILLHLDSN